MENQLRYEIKLTAKDFWKFSMYHSNGGVMGVFNLLFTLAALFALVTRFATLSVAYRGLLAVCVLMFTVWQPFLLYLKARKQANLPAMQQGMLLIFSEQGLHITQGEQTVEYAWEDMGRLDKIPSMVILYMDRVHAYLIPEVALGDTKEEFYEMVRSQLPKEKRRRI